MLQRHDHARLHGGRRQLLAGNTVYMFAAGNETEQPFSDLFYAFVKIGTPGKQYLVALDTGTDLLWLPCECQQNCSPLNVSSNDPRTNNLTEYSPSLSSTSKEILRNDTLCINATTSATAADQCPYTQDYNNLNTFNYSYVYHASSSGVLFEDNLYLTSEKGGREVSAPVVIGCGQTQTGGFLQDIAPDGVLGLGSGIISVPSALSRAGVVDSFSICLGIDGYGRIAFGDIGPLTQQTVPLLLSSSGQQDAVEIETIQIGSTTIQVSSIVSFDTGLTYTFLETIIFEQFVTAYKAQQPGLIPINYLGWEICYTSPVPDVDETVISLTFPNSNVLTPVHGKFGFVNQTGNGFTLCVGVLDGGQNTIIGQNFMQNFSFTFNRANQLLGWTQTNCYSDLTRSAPTPAPAPSAVPPPSGAPSTSPISAAVLAPKASSATASAHYVGVIKSVNPISPILSMSSLLVFLVCLLTLF